MRVVSIRFREAGKVCDVDAGDFYVEPGNTVIVETEGGLDWGCVIGRIREEDHADALPRIARLATPEDEERIRTSRENERRAMDVCIEKVAEHGLPMKIVGVERSFDGGKIIFYFTAEGRVDFRALVKDLAREFRTRIELRQIGVRDEAKMVGGIGPCGLVVCCATFLEKFDPVTIKMARCQRLSLNPNKISGLCGRLMCCLTFEHELYKRLSEGLPKDNALVETPDGEGKVVDLFVLDQEAKVEFPDGRQAVYPVGKLRVKKKRDK